MTVRDDQSHPATDGQGARRSQDGGVDRGDPGPVSNVAPDGVPDVAEVDLDAVVSGDILPDSAPPDADLPEETGEALEEDDDNPYQHSDEALPDDVEEAVIRRNPSREGGLFDEV